MQWPLLRLLAGNPRFAALKSKLHMQCDRKI